MLKFLLALVFILNVANCSNSDEYLQTIEMMARDPAFIKDFESNIKYLLEIEPNYFEYNPFNKNNFSFNCDFGQKSPSTPKTVHELRPSDIQVVAALGDSLTAGLGIDAKTVLGLLIEYRDRSWSIGGHDSVEKVVTVPNLLKKFNPNLKGYNTLPTFYLTNKEGSGLNVAVSGQEANHILDQAQRLVKRLKESKSINFENDWKLITLFIGGNDLCRFCKDYEKHSPAKYTEDIQAGLDFLYQQVPKAFVNLVSVLNVSVVSELNNGLVCNVLHRLTCQCGAFPVNNQSQEIKVYTEMYQQNVQSLVDTGNYDGRDDFTVVLQPFFVDFEMPRLSDSSFDFSYLSPDCFHFSSKGQAAAAVGLWNNLLQPVGRKTGWTKRDQLICPTPQNPYLFTKKNSNV